MSSEFVPGDHRAHLEAVNNRLPRSAFKIATTSWPRESALRLRRAFLTKDAFCVRQAVFLESELADGVAVEVGGGLLDVVREEDQVRVLGADRAGLGHAVDE